VNELKTLAQRALPAALLLAFARDIRIRSREGACTVTPAKRKKVGV
jgi:hypothetical protein